MTIAWRLEGATAPDRASPIAAPGSPRARSERALERFYRGSAGARTPGTGLGLAIVDSLVRRWGGTVRMRNRDGGGLVVAVDATGGLANRSPEPLTGSLPRAG